MCKNKEINLSRTLTTKTDIVPWIGEQQDMQFSRHPDILVVPGKLLELHSKIYFFSNPGGKVIIDAEISYSQDPRVWRKFYNMQKTAMVQNLYSYSELHWGRYLGDYHKQPSVHYHNGDNSEIYMPLKTSQLTLKNYLVPPLKCLYGD